MSAIMPETRAGTAEAPAPEAEQDVAAAGILSLVRTLQFADSVLPVGTFAFSAGLESAVQKGVVRHAEDLRRYALTALEVAARSDGVALAWALRAALVEDTAALIRIDQALHARKLGEENRQMSTRMGRKLAELGAQVVERPLLRQWREILESGLAPGTYAVSLAVLFAALDLPVRREDDLIRQALTVQLYGTAMTVLNAALRLMRVTHIDIQRILYDLTPRFAALCDAALHSPLEEMHGYAPMIDILAANHLRARVRLFMS